MAWNCPVSSCDRSVPAEYFMCPRHWRMVPKPLQAAVNRTWRARKNAPLGQYRSAVAPHEEAKATALAAVEELLQKGHSRHRWVKTVIEVPWSAAGGNLYHCRCGCTRQSVPDGRFYKTQYGIPTPTGFTYVDRAPECSYGWSLVVPAERNRTA